MIHSIIERHDKLTPLTETEIKIVATAAKLFLEQGFSATTHRQIAKEAGIGLGTLTYHYRAKEDLLHILMEELMDYHLDIIEAATEQKQDNLFAYATEITMQIALCETNKMAWDLYHAAYTHPTTFAYIKDWASKKAHHLLCDITNLQESDFKNLEHITSGIELAALLTACDRYFTLEDKIRLTLDSMMKIYDIPAPLREETIEKVLATDYEQLAQDMFARFVARL
ncbi:MAG: helix-turn-helix transcriptional regulator [Clostridia bacterium]|nr:helix-turn-helix transcriptional regulator [Clostridia bacterium]